MQLDIIIIIFTLISISCKKSTFLKAKDDNGANFTIDTPKSWQTNWDGNSLQFRPLNTTLIGEGSISRADASAKDDMNSLLTKAISEQTTPNTANFEDLCLGDSFQAKKDIEEFDLLGMDVEGYYVVIKANDDYYLLTAYYETDLKDVMRQGIESIVRSFKLKDNIDKDN
jgi:hypothetical protein